MSKNRFSTLLNSEAAKPTTLAIFVGFVALVGLFNALRFGGASLDYYFVRNSIEAWQETGLSQSEDNYKTAKNAIATANTLHRAHPLYNELQGQIKEWGALSGFEEESTLSQAKAYYLTATEQRPLWPVTWANLAMLKWRQQEFDDELSYYLSQADALGPQKAEVHILFTQLGLSLYNANHPFYIGIQDRVKHRIAMGLRSPYSRRAVASFISNTNSSRAVCRWMNAYDQYVYENFIRCPKKQ